MCKISVYPALHIQPKVASFGAVPKHVEQSFISMIIKEHVGESTILLKWRKRPVGRSLYNNLFWNHRRPAVVLKTLSNNSLSSASILSISLHLSKRLVLSMLACQYLQQDEHVCLYPTILTNISRQKHHQQQSHLSILYPISFGNILSQIIHLHATNRQF